MREETRLDVFVEDTLLGENEKLHTFGVRF